MIEQRQHFGVYGLVLNRAADHILLVHKIFGCYAGLYDMPGGTQEQGESYIQTLTREMKEEAMLTVRPDSECLGQIQTEFFFEDKGVSCVLNHRAVIFRVDDSSALETNVTSLDTGGTIWVPVKDCKVGIVTPIVIGALSLHA